MYVLTYICLCACVCHGGCADQRRPFSGVSSLSCSSQGSPHVSPAVLLVSRLAGLQSLDCFWYALSLYHKDAGIRCWVLEASWGYQTCVTNTFTFWTISLPYAFLTSSTVIWRGHLRSHPLTSSCSLIIPDIPKVLHFSHQEFSFMLLVFYDNIWESSYLRNISQLQRSSDCKACVILNVRISISGLHLYTSIISFSIVVFLLVYCDTGDPKT